ncbi:MAG: catalase [Pseudomonadales bacterium]
MKTRLTTSAGAPVAEDNHSITAGERGPLTFDNYHLFEKLAHFNRERIPERVVHARGAGAYGKFTLKTSLSEVTCADFLQNAGRQTEVFVRFSTVGGGQDSSDYARDPRGFAIKFYTDEGNYDIVGNNTPVFFLNDPLKFPDFVHSQKKNPQTNLPDAARMWEFWANHPQSLHQMTILMSDRGIPRSWRHMNGYGSHTFSFYTREGSRHWMKWHFKTDQGVQCLGNEEASILAPHGAQQDLVEAIAQGEYPSWTVMVQILSEAQASRFPLNPFDLTKVWPHEIAPLQVVGKLELNRNVENYFAETEQVGFAPSNFVPGIGPSPDKMLQARLLAYQDAHRYRIGANHNQIKVNMPRCPVHHYQQDGRMANVGHSNSQSGEQNFYPNDRQDLASPSADLSPPGLQLEAATVRPYNQDDEDYYSQAGNLYRILSTAEQGRLVNNIADGLCQATESIQARIVEFLRRADQEYADKVHWALTELEPAQVQNNPNSGS